MTKITTQIKIDLKILHSNMNFVQLLKNFEILRVLNIFLFFLQIYF